MYRSAGARIDFADTSRGETKVVSVVSRGMTTGRLRSDRRVDISRDNRSEVTYEPGIINGKRIALST